eukprot:14987390-Ditylum_brightwellii.AAC.1
MVHHQTGRTGELLLKREHRHHFQASLQRKVRTSCWRSKVSVQSGSLELILDIQPGIHHNRIIWLSSS